MLLMPMLMASASGGALDFALNAPNVTVEHAYRAGDYTAGDWPDRVGSADLTQGTGDNQPTAVADGGAGLNNKPVVRFDGSNDYLDNGTISISQPHWFVAIGKMTLNNANNKTLAQSVNTTCRMLIDSAERVRLDNGVTGINSASSILNSNRLLLGQFNGATSEIRIDSVVAGSGNAGTNALDGVIVSNTSASGNINAMDLAELIIGSGTWGHADLVALARYCAQYYGFAAPFPQTSAPTETPFSSGSTTHNVDMPTSVSAGELLTVNICLRVSALSPTAITTPAGWTLKASQTAGATSFSWGTFNTYCKIADGTEGGTQVNFESDDSSATGAAQCHKDSIWYGSLDGVEVSTARGGTANPDSPSLSPSWGSKNTLWRSVAGWVDDDVAVSSYPTDYTGGVDTISGAGGNSGAAVGSARRERAAATENPGSFTLASTEAWMAQTIAVRPIQA